MKRWILLATLAVVLLLGFFVGKPYVEARMSWYYLGDRLWGDNLLITCQTETPIFNYGGLSWETEAEEPFFSGLEVFLVCQTLERNIDVILAEKGQIYGGIRSLSDLVDGISGCGHRMFSPEETEVCATAYYDSIDWMIENGAEINPPDSCGYLPITVMTMDEKMFDFLLSRGADPNQLCPPLVAEFGDGVESLIDTESKTVAELITALLSEYTDEDKATIVAGWVRMLETIEGSEN